jgi:hypothetical protein
VAETRVVGIRSDALLISDPAAARDQSAEELRLWADYYEAVTRALEIVRGGCVTPATFREVLAANARASATLTRIKQIYDPDA